MGVMKAGVPNGGVSGNSEYFTPNQAYPGGKSGGPQFWSRGWGQTEASPKAGAKERGGMMKGGKGPFGSKHGKCVGCGG